MLKLAITLGITSTALLAICVFLIWYGRKLLSNLLYLSENIGDLLAIMNNFSLHLESINEMELYYFENPERATMLMDIMEEGDYEEFFRKALAKFGVSSPDELDDEKKKDFFNYVDKNYKADNETD